MKHLWNIWILAVACAVPGEKAPVVLEEVPLEVGTLQDYPHMLSAWGLFQKPLKELIPADTTLFPYQINAALFSDYAFKARFIQLPQDSVMGYHPSEVVSFPVGTVLIKNFYYPADFRDPEGARKIIETRLLIHETKGWKAIVYKWNEAQTDAERVIVGEEVPVEWVDDHGKLQRISYSIPSQPQCKSCHDLNGKITPIGPSVRQLNIGSQLRDWAAAGRIRLPEEALPRLVNYADKTAPLEQRARAWLEVNCAHCHRREGPAKNSGLYLLASEQDPYRLGINKPPIAAGKGSGGLKYSIVPCDPDASILVHRITSLEPGEMMPELGRKMRHQEGIQLIREWIAAMKCD